MFGVKCQPFHLKYIIIFKICKLYVSNNIIYYETKMFEVINITRAKYTGKNVGLTKTKLVINDNPVGLRLSK